MGIAVKISHSSKHAKACLNKRSAGLSQASFKIISEGNSNGELHLIYPTTKLIANNYPSTLIDQSSHHQNFTNGEHGKIFDNLRSLCVHASKFQILSVALFFLLLFHFGPLIESKITICTRMYVTPAPRITVDKY